MLIENIKKLADRTEKIIGDKIDQVENIKKNIELAKEHESDIWLIESCVGEVIDGDGSTIKMSVLYFGHDGSCKRYVFSHLINPYYYFLNSGNGNYDEASETYLFSLSEPGLGATECDCTVTTLYSGEKKTISLDDLKEKLSEYKIDASTSDILKLLKSKIASSDDNS